VTNPQAFADESTAAGTSRWTVAIFALIGLGVGLIVFALRTPTYQAETLVAVSNPIGSITDEVNIVLGETVMSAASSSLGFTPELQVTAAEVANLITIRASARNPQQAADAANIVAGTYVQSQQGAAAQIAQDAVAPDSASGLGPLVFAAVGTLLGALLGVFISYLKMVRLPARTKQPEQHRATALPDSSVAAPPSFISDSRPLGPVEIMDTKPTDSKQASTFAHASPFSDAAVEPASDGGQSQGSGQKIETGAWLTESEPTPTASVDSRAYIDLKELEHLDRRAVQSQFETAHYELVLAHEEETAHLRAEHERQLAKLRAEVGDLNKRVRMQAVRLKGRAGTDQTRVGDLEAQLDALEAELAESRQTLETERIANTKRLTDDRGIADRSLDNARRQYREELAKHVHTHRQTLAAHRAELDRELAHDRAAHASALEAQHTEYEHQLAAERHRGETKLNAATERHAQELADLNAATQQELERQAIQHKETIESLRGSTESTDVELRELGKENRSLRVEITSLRKQARLDIADHGSIVQRLNDELTILRNELEGERERNTALRADVLRRSSDTHQAIDRAVEERTAQLAELEASVARQREYADTRVREMSAAAEDQSRQSAVREANLAAEVSRLKRELEAISPGKPFDV